MKKILMLINILMITLFVFSGCSLKSKTPTAEQILADYNENYSDTSYANFSKIEVNSENDNDSLYIANVVLKGEDAYAEYTLETNIYYSFNDETGWTFLERRSSQVDYTLVRGRSEEDIKEWILQNGSKIIPYSTDITYLSSSLSSTFYENGTQTVNIKWTEQRFDVYGECEGELDFYYKKGYGWEYHGKKTTSEKYKIVNMDNTVWRYKHRMKKVPKNLEPVYHDFTIKSISDNGLCITAEYDGKTYVGYAKENENIRDGQATYYFPEGGLLRGAILWYASTMYFDDEDYFLRLDIDIPGGGYFDFVRIR